MRNSAKWLVVLALVVLAANAFANPANPHARTFTQPDGSKFQAKLKGDEHFIFAETMDGYSIIMDQNTNYWTYANAENGLLVPTSYVVGKSVCPFKAHLRPNAITVAALPQNKGKMINVTSDARHKSVTDFLYASSGSKAPAGRRYVDVLLGDFTDSTFKYYSNKQRLGQNPYQVEAPYPYSSVGVAGDSLANNYWFRYLISGDSLGNNTAFPWLCDSSKVGSMSNFYRDMTFNKAWWAGQVYGPRSTGQAWSTTANGMPSSTYYSSSVTNADAAVNFKKNGTTMDAVIIIHPGPEQQMSGRAGDISSMTWSVSVTTAEGAVTPLVFCGQAGQLGVMAHEMFHQIGGPDLYDYGYTGEPWGYWSLMDMGSWGGDPVSGSEPPFAGGHLTYDIDGNLTNGIDGWFTASAVGNCDSISSLYRGDGSYTVAVLDSAGEARRSGTITKGIRLWRIRNNNFRDSSQIFLVENRQRTPPYESGLPEAGIIITHIDTRMEGAGVNFNGGPPDVRAFYSWVEQPGCDINKVYPTGDTTNYDRASEVAAYSADDYSIGGYPQTTLDSTSIPNSWINQCYPTTSDRTGPFIFNVGREAPYMTFNVLRTGMAATVPLVSYQFNTIKDPTPGNNNSILDPWETDTIRMTFRNDATAITAGAACSLYAVVNPQYVIINNPSWQVIGAGGIATGAQAQSGPFVVAVSKDAPRFTNITFAIKFRSTTPSVNDTFYFNCNISALNVVKTYDFSNLYAGGTDYRYRISPSDLCIYGDTLFLSNANLDNAVFQTRLYKVKKSTTSNPLVPADTFGSLNNKVTLNNTNYAGGMDIEPSTGTLWWTIEDTIYNSTRGNTLIKKMEGPNTDWAGTAYLKRMRGLAFGPTVVDTVGTDIISGDSLLVYWQQLNATSNLMNTDSLMNYRKVASGTTTIARRWAFSDSGWPGASDYGYGWNAWNGRGIENDGQSIWSSVIDDNTMMRRDGDGKIIEMFPGPSATSGYGVYGMSIEHTTAAGVSYAPDGGAGAPAFVPYARGTKTYLYCAAMGEGKIYKVDVTEFMIPTPPDSIRVTAMSATQNQIIIKKSNAPQQKVAKYYIYRRDDSTTPLLTDSIGFKNTGRVAGQVATVDTFYDNAAKSGKASHFYSVLSVNYSGVGDWGASVSAPLLEPDAVELSNFALNTSGYSVLVNWSTASELNSKAWDIQRSSDGVVYASVGSLPTHGTTNSAQTYSYTDNVTSAGTYYYRLYEISLDGNSKLVYSDKIVVGNMPVRYELAQNYPNPAGPSATRIDFALKNPGKTTLKIYNVLGEETKTLINGEQLNAGFYTGKYAWDCTDNKGQQASNGIYFYKLISGDFTATKKLTVLK